MARTRALLPALFFAAAIPAMHAAQQLSAPPAGPHDATVVVAASGALRLRLEHHTHRVTLDQLSTALARPSRFGTRTVYVRAGNNVPYGKVEAVLERIRQTGSINTVVVTAPTRPDAH